jgi:predicted nucleic acid-binding Zn ribbon protein
MPENLPDHAHCLECDAAIPIGKQFCSDQCESARNAKIRRQKNRNLMYTVILLVIIVTLGFVSMLL